MLSHAGRTNCSREYGASSVTFASRLSNLTPLGFDLPAIAADETSRFAAWLVGTECPSEQEFAATCSDNFVRSCTRALELARSEAVETDIELVYLGWLEGVTAQTSAGDK